MRHRVKKNIHLAKTGHFNPQTKYKVVTFKACNIAYKFIFDKSKLNILFQHQMVRHNTPLMFVTLKIERLDVYLQKHSKGVNVCLHRCETAVITPISVLGKVN